LHLHDLTALSAGIRFADVLGRTPNKLRPHIARRIQSGGLEGIS
jgi:hypothetical protein